MAHLNVRSLKNKIEQVYSLLHNKPIDVLTISETWLTPQVETTILSIEGYEVCRSDRVRSPRQSANKGGGLLTYTGPGCVVNASTYNHLNICNAHLRQW